MWGVFLEDTERLRKKKSCWQLKKSWIQGAEKDPGMQSPFRSLHVLPYILHTFNNLQI